MGSSKQFLILFVLLSTIAFSYGVLTCYECASSLAKCPNQVSKVCPNGQVCGTASLTKNGMTHIGKGCTTADACSKGADSLVKNLIKTADKKSAGSTLTCKSCATDLCNAS